MSYTNFIWLHPLVLFLSYMQNVGIELSVNLSDDLLYKGYKLLLHIGCIFGKKFYYSPFLFGSNYSSF